MKNQYVGDIGDYGKYGLLRFLASYGIKIGVNWFLTENDGSTDGKFTTYLKNPADRVYDPELFDALQNIADHPDKTIKMIEQAGIIPGAEFYGELLKSSSLKADAREWNRRLWFNNSTLMLGNAELIFADPDNGISYRKTARTKDSEKFILPEDVAEYTGSLGAGKGRDQKSYQRRADPGCHFSQGHAAFVYICTASGLLYEI